MNTPIVFPASAEKFIAYQEQLAGRPLNSLERKVTAAWLPSINQAYGEGAGGEDITDDLAHMEELISRYAIDTVLLQLLRAVTLWMCRAWVQGFNEYQNRKELDENDAV